MLFRKIFKCTLNNYIHPSSSFFKEKQKCGIQFKQFRMQRFDVPGASCKNRYLKVSQHGQTHFEVVINVKRA